VVTRKNDIQGKLQNRDTFCMFVGYSVDHANAVYRMLNLENNYIISSRGIKWIKMYHKDQIKQKDPVSHYAVYLLMFQSRKSVQYHKMSKILLLYSFIVK
jgi:hypothetical protein